MASGVEIDKSSAKFVVVNTNDIQCLDSKCSIELRTGTSDIGQEKANEDSPENISKYMIVSVGKC